MVALHPSGALAFLLGLVAALRQLGMNPIADRAARPVAAYAIGITAAFWFIECVAGFMP